MKMENELKAPRAGTLRELGVSEGDAVETGALLALLE
jgi:biotin carboxyl carrier protein